MRIHRYGMGLSLALIAIACGSSKGAVHNNATDATDAGPETSTVDTDASSADTGPVDSGPATQVGSGNDKCAAASQIPLSAGNPRADLMATTVGASHDIDVPCASEQGPDVFYQFTFSKRVFVYADTFGATANTSLFFLDSKCEPITASTTTGDAVCNDDECGSTQSRVVAVLEPGSYRLGMATHGGEAAATIHFEWALAGSGTVAQLPMTNSVQTGTTASANGNIDGISDSCVAAGPENSYWWARCPSDPEKTLLATTCGGGTTWESVVEAQIPKSAPGQPSAYKCNVDGCGDLQASLTTKIPAGAGLGVLSIDGQAGNDFGDYTMAVTFTP